MHLSIAYLYLMFKLHLARKYPIEMLYFLIEHTVIINLQVKRLQENIRDRF